MLVKMYKNYTPLASEVYHQMRATGVLSLILRYANEQKLKSLSEATQQEIDIRKGSSEYTLDKITMLKILQRDSMSHEQLLQLYKLAIRYNYALFATCLQTVMISYGDKETAKDLFKKEFTKDHSFIFTELGKGLLVNLYRESSDNLLDIEDCALRRFLAEQA